MAKILVFSLREPIHCEHIVSLRPLLSSDSFSPGQSVLMRFWILVFSFSFVLVSERGADQLYAFQCSLQHSFRVRTSVPVCDSKPDLKPWFCIYAYPPVFDSINRKTITRGEGHVGNG